MFVHAMNHLAVVELVVVFVVAFVVVVDRQ
jgi:hypothetical protein